MTSDTSSTLSLDYHFNEAEVKFLAHFFRKHQAELPKELVSFAGAIERSIYNSMSIDEVEQFYS